MALVALAILGLNHLQLSFCLFDAALGIPCPGCGVSRGLWALFDLRLADAVSFNPGVLLVAAYLVSLCLRDFYDGEKLTRLSSILGRGMLILLLSVWCNRLL